MRSRLSILYFLQFGIWGCYLTCFGQLLGAGGLGRSIAWFYAAIGIVSILTPAVMGHIADKMKQPGLLLSVCHGAAATAMLVSWFYASTTPTLDFVTFYILYLLFLLFYMPTMALANTVSFGLLKSHGIKPVDAFPSIRVWGTVGFVAAMWFVNSVYFHDGHLGIAFSDTAPLAQYRFQYTSTQLLCASITGLITSLYALTLPALPFDPSTKPLIKGVPGLKALRHFFSNSTTRVFLIFAAFSGVCLQISNGFATPYINHFMGIEKYAGSIASGNATMLFSLSQISEAAAILLVGITMKRFGIKTVIAIGLSAWALRFVLLGLGNPGDGLWMLVASMIVYGIAFNFITIAGHLFMEQSSDSNTKGLGQGVMMLMSNGFGATVGTLTAGVIVNRWCHWEMVTMPDGSRMQLFSGDWIWPWIIFGIYAAALALLWCLFFKRNKG